MMAWVTDLPNWVNNRTTSVEYRFLSSMQGSLGVGANLDRWTPDDFAVAKDMIAAYKQVRETVQHDSVSANLPPAQQRIFRYGVRLTGQAAGCPLHLSRL